jgi:predicted nucleotidyltransferase
VSNQKIIKSFEVKDELNPKFWNKNKELNPKVRNRLLQIAEEFVEFLKVPVVVDDILFIGSLTNYGWSDYSDIDLLISCDFEQFPKEDLNLYEELFKVKKVIFNTTHNIKIFGYDVELYVEDSNKGSYSNGVFSVLNNEWVIEPKKENVKIDKEVLNKKVNNWSNKIDTIIDNTDIDDYSEAIKLSKKLKDKLGEYRSLGLKNKGEFSYENLVYKYLRRSGHLDKLRNFENELLDKQLSLVEQMLFFIKK